jgi:Ca-activated chloride channel family protein
MRSAGKLSTHGRPARAVAVAVSEGSYSAGGWLALLVVLLVLLGLCGLLPPTLAATAPDTPPIKFPEELKNMPVQEVRVRLVLLQATVTDRQGKIVDDLGPGDFRVEENGVPRDITVFGRAADHPLELAFLLDISGSMSVQGKLDRARAAIRQFVGELRPEDRTALMVFADGDVVVRVPFTTDRLRFLNFLEDEEAWGQTALRDGLAYASSILADSNPGRKALVLVTDGVDNASEVTSFEAIRLARQVRVPIYALGFTGLPIKMAGRGRGPEKGRSFLEVLAQVAEETGGLSFPVFDVSDVSQAVAAVQDRLRNQYVLGYDPGGDDGESMYHRIQVVAGDGGYQVSTRSGYYARD